MTKKEAIEEFLIYPSQREAEALFEDLKNGMVDYPQISTAVIITSGIATVCAALIFLIAVALK